MKPAVHLALFTLLGVAPALASQQSSPEGAVSYASLVSTTTSVRTADPVVIRSRMEQGNELLASGRFEAAAREFTAAAQMHREQRTSAAEALWKLAETHHYRGHSLRAAALFDQAAEEAGKYGDPVLQAQALLEAAIGYHRSGRNDLALVQMNRLDPLLDSPFLPEAVRSAIENRIIRS